MRDLPQTRYTASVNNTSNKALYKEIKAQQERSSRGYTSTTLLTTHSHTNALISMRERWFQTDISDRRV